MYLNKKYVIIFVDNFGGVLLKDKKKRFKLIDLERDGRGISKSSSSPDNSLKRFFRTLWDNAGKILYVNILMVLGNFPIFFLIAVLSGYTKYTAYLPSGDLFQNLSGVFMMKEASPYLMSLYALEGLPNQILINSVISYVFIGISLLTLLTFGIVNVGTAYILRNIAKGDPVFVWSDFWYAIRRNYKQALPFGAIDALINALLIYNVFITVTGSNFITSVMFWINVILFVLYFFMRFYIYVQMVTFKLSVFKILKNSLSFALLGFKRNILVLFAAMLFLAIELCTLFAFGGIFISIAVIFPLSVMFSVLAYMKVFASYFKIKEIMIDPYYAEHPELLVKEEYDDEQIMRDDVTDRERLEEIKRRNGIS